VCVCVCASYAHFNMHNVEGGGEKWATACFLRLSLPSFLLALQPWVSLGLLNNPPPFLSILHRLHSLLYPHCSQVCYIIHPSQTRSSFSSSYKQSSLHHLSWHRSLFHSLYMSQPSYSLSFYKFHNILCLWIYSVLHYF